MLPRWSVFLVFLGAAVLVGAVMAGLAASLSDLDSPDLLAPPPADPTEFVAPTPEATSNVAAPIDPSVCSGILSRPAEGEPRRVAAEYTQQIEVEGILVVANERVDAEALDVARETLEHMFANNDVDERLAAEGAYIVVASSDQGILEIPEFRCLAQTSGPNSYDHICGVADYADFPVATVNELDLLGDPRGPCGGLNILYHEAGHLVQNFGIDHADYIDTRLLYQAALDQGLYEREYASTNSHEYFAEGVQSYFHGDLEGGRDREWLAEYDPALYQMLARIFGE